MWLGCHAFELLLLPATCQMHEHQSRQKNHALATLKLPRATAVPAAAVFAVRSGAYAVLRTVLAPREQSESSGKLGGRADAKGYTREARSSGEGERESMNGAGATERDKACFEESCAFSQRKKRVTPPIGTCCCCCCSCCCCRRCCSSWLCVRFFLFFLCRSYRRKEEDRSTLTGDHDAGMGWNKQTTPIGTASIGDGVVGLNDDDDPTRGGEEEAEENTDVRTPAHRHTHTHGYSG